MSFTPWEGRGFHVVCSEAGVGLHKGLSGSPLCPTLIPPEARMLDTSPPKSVVSAIYLVIGKNRRWPTAPELIFQAQARPPNRGVVPGSVSPTMGGVPGLRPARRAPVALCQAWPRTQRGGVSGAGLAGLLRPARAAGCRRQSTRCGKLAARCRCQTPASGGGRPRAAPAGRNGPAGGVGAAGNCRTPELETTPRGAARLA